MEGGVRPKIEGGGELAREAYKGFFRTKNKNEIGKLILFDFFLFRILTILKTFKIID